MTVLDLIPRRADGLPPGQRELRRFPRFADNPLRPPPAAGPPRLTVSIEGETAREIVGADWDRFEHVEQVSDFHCVTTWSVRDLRWVGVRLADVIDQVVGANPPYAVADAADGTRAVFVTDDLLGDDVLLATELNGRALDLRHGAPLRLVCPSQYGYKNIKHLVGIDFRAEEPRSRYGSKEHLRGRVALEERHATLPNWALRVPYRLVIAPTALLAERSLRKAVQVDRGAGLDQAADSVTVQRD